jgi:hypothetical protein
MIWALPGYGDTIETVNANDVFVPVGFDDNDTTMVVIEGLLPNGCYKAEPSKVVKDIATQTIKILPQARVSAGPCTKALVPFAEEINLGVLPFGTYQVNVNQNQALSADLEVEEATSSGPDEFLYAPVDNVLIDRVAQSMQMVATLSGRFTDSCMKMVDVKVIDSGKTLQVLPIIEVEDLPACLDGLFPYKQTFKLPKTMSSGRHLLHVRSLNGKAINELFSVTPIF